MYKKVNEQWIHELNKQKTVLNTLRKFQNRVHLCHQSTTQVQKLQPLLIVRSELENQCFSIFPTSWHTDKVLKSSRHTTNILIVDKIVDNAADVDNVAGGRWGSHTLNEPTNKWPFTKLMQPTCKLFMAHKCATAHWLQLMPIKNSSPFKLRKLTCLYMKQN